MNSLSALVPPSASRPPDCTSLILTVHLRVSASPLSLVAGTSPVSASWFMPPVPPAPAVPPVPPAPPVPADPAAPALPPAPPAASYPDTEPHPTAAPAQIPIVTTTKPNEFDMRDHLCTTSAPRNQPAPPSQKWRACNN